MKLIIKILIAPYQTIFLDSYPYLVEVINIITLISGSDTFVINFKICLKALLTFYYMREL